MWKLMSMYHLLIILGVFTYGYAGKVAYVDFPESSLSLSTSCHLPEKIIATVSTVNVTVTLQLRKCKDVGDDATVYIVKHGGIGSEIIKDNVVPYQKSAEYQDKNNAASVEISCHLSTSNVFHYQLNGIMSLPDGMIYTIQKFSVNYSPADPVNIYELQPVDTLKFGRGSTTVKDKVIFPKMSRHTEATTERRRSKRQTEAIYVDVVFIIEYSVYQRWYSRSNTSDATQRQQETKQNVKRYFAHIANGINLRFKTISDRYNIRLVGYVIEDERPAEWLTSVTSKEVEGARLYVGSDLLKSVRNWTSTIASFPQNDFVVTWTAYELYDVEDNVTFVGLAYNGTICKAPAYSISLCQSTDRMVFDMLTATHEIGHGLGALHDGQENPCRKEDVYIMSTSRERVLTNNHPFLFSVCAKDSIRKHAEDIEASRSELSKSCLFTSINPVSTPNISGEMPGLMYHPDTQCRMVFDQRSFYCRGVKQRNEAICKQMPCLNPETGLCAGIYAAEGTSCGNQKWCIAGECVYSDQAPQRNETCLYGNTPGIVYGNETCDEFIPVHNKHMCYDEGNSLWCCGTCLRYSNNEPGCPYGDNRWNTTCIAGLCPARNGTNYVDVCCDTCRAFRTTSSTPLPTTTTTVTTTEATTTTTTTTTTTDTTKTTATTVTTTEATTTTIETSVTTVTTTTTAAPITTTPTATTTTATLTSITETTKVVATSTGTTTTVTVTTQQQAATGPSSTVAVGGTRAVHSSAILTVSLVGMCYLCIVKSIH